MRYGSLSHFLRDGRQALARGPVALILAEDAVEVESTIRHHQMTGFREVVLFAPADMRLSDGINEMIYRVDFETMADGATQLAVNTVIDAAPGLWLYYCYNAEYLFFPFCETRSIGEMLTFHSEERRDAVLAFVVDLYADDLEAHPNAVSRRHACLDRTGYYALARPDPANHGHPMERQLDFHGGLRWRFEEHVPPAHRRIDRVALFRAKRGLGLRENHTFNDEEYNTYACPWHNNITVAIASFRTAKALKSNAGSTFDISTFRWHNTTPFEWNSQQLMELGLMEPGQWF